MVFSLSIELRKQDYNYDGSDVGVVYDEWTNHLCVYLQALVNKSLTW